MKLQTVSNEDLIMETRAVASEMMDDDRFCANLLFDVAEKLPVQSTTTVWERGDQVFVDGAARVTVEMVRPNGVLVRRHDGRVILIEADRLLETSQVWRWEK